MLKTIIGPALLLALLLIPIIAGASDFDGNKPLLCATIEAFECDAGQDCQEVPIEDINLPRFLHIDFKNRHISGTREDGEERTTVINNMAQLPDRLVMQGVQNALGWNLIITAAGGKMTLTASGPNTGFVAFGACTATKAQ